MIQLLVINDGSFTPGNQSSEGFEFEVTLSDSPLHAFNTIIHISPDAIILNMSNPGMDGQAVLKRIRNMQASKEVPVLIAVSAINEPMARDIVDNDKNTEYMVAPVSRREVFKWASKATGATGDDDKKNVMVVDDDPVVLDLVKLYLGARYRVITMNSAQEAIARLNVVVPDIILLDIAMPDMDGKELYRVIRLIEGCEDVPILFQTGMAGINTVRECVKLGAAGFVIKPIQKAVLLERIEETLSPQDKDESGKCICVFEDFDFLYTLIHGYLKDSYEVTRGESVLQTINHLEEHDMKCVIVDYDNSAFMLNRIREKTSELHIPIVLLSRDIRSQQIMIELNKKNTYISQLPLSKDSLLDTIRNMASWVDD